MKKIKSEWLPFCNRKIQLLVEMHGPNFFPNSDTFVDQLGLEGIACELAAS